MPEDQGLRGRREKACFFRNIEELPLRALHEGGHVPVTGTDTSKKERDHMIEKSETQKPAGEEVRLIDNYRPLGLKAVLAAALVNRKAAKPAVPFLPRERQPA